ncbi:MAG TPA: SGNH/GDSL hydrolase family protein [Xanthomonadales bacterium]|nr:SGNH/GDSL hydrolase family protein [Xanthomonadales bacterium]
MAMAVTPMEPDVTYLALGDSYTIGESVDEAGRWPVQLAKRLRDEGVSIGAPRIVAKTGWTTDELSAAMDAAALAPRYGFVSLLIGVNNQYRGRELDEYEREFAALLARAIALAGGRADRVLVLSIPDWGTTPFAEGRVRRQIALDIDAFNAAAKAECERRGVAYVDVTGISRERRELVAGDGLHPSAEQYTLWAEAALPVAEKLLGSK